MRTVLVTQRVEVLADRGERRDALFDELQWRLWELSEQQYRRLASWAVGPAGLLWIMFGRRHDGLEAFCGYRYCQKNVPNS